MSSAELESDTAAPNEMASDNWTYYGGLIALAVAFGVNSLAGTIYNEAEAREMVDALSTSALRFGAAIATSSTTILALMLALVGITRNADENFGGGLYKRVQRLGTLSTVSLCWAIFLLLVLSLPVGEFENLPGRWYTFFYWLLVTLISGLTGLAITVVLMLYNAIQHVIETLASD